MQEHPTMEGERSVRMPQQTVMLERLDRTHFLLKQRGVFQRFVERIANGEQSGSTLVTAWEQACEEGLRNSALRRDVAITRLLHAYAFPKLINVITPDPQVAREARKELEISNKSANER